MKSIKLYVERSVGRRYCIRVIPFEILGDAIPNVYGLKVRVVAFVECSSIGIEFIGELG